MRGGVLRVGRSKAFHRFWEEARGGGEEDEAYSPKVSSKEVQFYGGRNENRRLRCSNE